jgi:catechol 2,3-dioxygenase-like lactoylglutathione lyase family enzyme
MTSRLEHANLSVRDIDAELSFILTAFPDFRVRHDGVDASGRRWVHVGNNDAYIALYQAATEGANPSVPYSGRPGLNHLGFEVEDAAALRDRLRAAGCHESTVPNNHPYRKRVYFHDPEGNDWEFVQYLTDVHTKRHDYALPDA